MYIKKKKFIFLISTVFVIISCATQTLLSLPKETPPPLLPNQKIHLKPKECENLTSKQCEELEINEGELNPFPG